MNEMKRTEKLFLNRRNLLTTGAIAAGVATASSIIPGSVPVAFGQDSIEDRRGLDKGDVAILRFLAAAELIESDLWQQYSELGGESWSDFPRF